MYCYCQGTKSGDTEIGKVDFVQITVQYYRG